MQNNYLKITIKALIISFVGVMVIDYFAHLLFSDPMETVPYFLAKMVLYFVFSILFLSFFDSGKNRFLRVLIAGIIVASIFGFYYNLVPVIIDKVFGVEFYPFGIALGGLTFLGMGLLGTGAAFGTVHTIAFVGGYYAAKLFSAKFLDQPRIGF